MSTDNIFERRAGDIPNGQRMQLAPEYMAPRLTVWLLWEGADTIVGIFRSERGAKAAMTELWPEGFAEFRIESWEVK